MLSNLLDRFWATKPRNVPKIELTKTGFECTEAERSHSIPWAQIEGIDAFKRDELTTDLICLEIWVSDGSLLLHEEMEGFASFRAAMEETLAISPDWFGEVMLPPFAANLRRIFPAMTG